MRDFYVFDIPVYRCTAEQYCRDQESYVERHLHCLYEDKGRPRPPVTDEQLMRVKGRAARRFGGPWEFNQVIGWVRLFLEGYNVGAHTLRVDARRMTRYMRHKTLWLTTTSSCIWPGIKYPSTSEDIFNRVLAELERLAKDKLKKRYVDLRVFRRTGPFIDWHQLLLSNLNRPRE